jgi:hypothetical protein
MATTIQFDDESRAKRSNTRDSGLDDLASPTGGVYSLRNISRSSLERRWARTSLKERFDDEEHDEDAGLHNEADFKKRQVQYIGDVRIRLELTCTGFPRKDALLVGVPVNWSHLRRYWH